MKKTFLLSALAVIFTLIGCKDSSDNVETVSISVNPTSLDVASAASSNNVALKASGSWTATTAADWVTLSVNSGNGDAALIVMVEANEATEVRLAEVVFTAGDSQATLSIEQAAYGSTAAASFDVDGIICTSSSIYANVTPQNYTGTWYVGCAPTYLFEDTSDEGFSGDKLTLAEFFMYLECDYYGTDLSYVDYMYVFEGACEGVDLIAGWGGADDTEYAIVIFGMNAAGDILTDVTLVTAATNAVNLTDMTIDCQFSNVTSSSATYEVYPSDKENYYIFGFYTDVLTYIANGGTDADLFQTVLSNSVGDDGAIYAFQGDLIDYNGAALQLTGLPASAELSFVGFGLEIDYEQGMVLGRCTDAQISTINTPANSAAAQNSWTSVEPNVKLIDVTAPMNLEQKMIQSRATSKKFIVKK